MSPRAIQVVTYVLAGLVLALYVLFVLWRVRVDKRRKAVGTPPEVVRAPERRAPTSATVADLLKGVKLPADLAPLTDLVARPELGDRVAFWTDAAPAAAVEDEMRAELERLGFTLSSPERSPVRAERDGQVLMTVVHAAPAVANVGGRPAFPSVPTGAVVVEVYVA